MAEIRVAPQKTQCKACGDKAKVLLDYSSGDLICTTCGLVLEGRCFDDGADWRDFAPEGVESGMHAAERERADRRDAHDMFSDEVGSTMMMGNSKVAQSLQRAQALSNTAGGSSSASSSRSEQKVLKTFVAKIRETAGRLALGEGIVNRCIGLFQDLVARNALKSNRQASYYCALVHIASVQERATRTIHELAEANVTNNKREADFAKQIDKRVKEINRALGLAQPAAYVEDQDLMARFVNRLQLSPQVCKPASFISREAYKYGLVGKQPQTAIVASSIFIVAWLLHVEEKPKFTDVAGIAKVSEVAVRSSYKSIHKAIRRLLPRDFICRLPGGIDSLPLP